MAKSRDQKRKELTFEVGHEESDIIEEIAARAVLFARRNGLEYSKLDAIMDLTACHANGCALKLRDLLAAKDGDFAHDVFGIRRYLDRQTGELTDCFLPRYSRPDGR